MAAIRFGSAARARKDLGVVVDPREKSGTSPRMAIVIAASHKPARETKHRRSRSLVDNIDSSDAAAAAAGAPAGARPESPSQHFSGEDNLYFHGLRSVGPMSRPTSRQSPARSCTPPIMRPFEAPTPEQTLHRELLQISETNGRIVEATERLDALGESEGGRKPGDVKLIVTPLPLTFQSPKHARARKISANPPAPPQPLF
eukprot:m.223349 g.223349  ORF g.223349 m.223349 type:complete len:201 (-) comp16239_c0_seq1:639-1241(-)